MGGKKIVMQAGSKDIYQKSVFAMDATAKKTAEEKRQKAALTAKALAEQRKKEAQQLQALVDTQTKVMMPLTVSLRKSGGLLGKTLENLLDMSTQVGDVDLEKANRMYKYVIGHQVQCISDTNFFTNKEDFMSQLRSELQILNQSKTEIGRVLPSVQKAWSEYKGVVDKNPKAKTLLSQQELSIIKSNMNDATTGLKNIPSAAKALQNSIYEWEKKWDELNATEKTRGC